MIGQLSRLNKASNVTKIEQNVELAPPVLNIPFEATNSASIKIKGFTTANSKVQIYLDDNLVDTQTSDTNGNFITNSIDLVMGTNNIYGKSIDENKQESLPSKTIQIRYNNEKPELTIDEPNDGKEIKGGDKKVTIRGKTDPDNDVNINGLKVIINSDGTFSTTVDLNDGDNTLNITAKNSVGNSTSVSRKIIYSPS